MATYPSAPPLQNKFITVRIDDVSTAGSAWVVPGFRGRIVKMHSVIDGAIATADATITVEIGGTAVSGAALTITQSGSAAGDIDTAEVAAGSTNTFQPSDALEVITDGASTNTVTAMITFELAAT